MHQKKKKKITLLGPKGMSITLSQLILNGRLLLAIMGMDQKVI